MIIKKKRPIRKWVKKKEEKCKSATPKNVVFATREEIDASISKILEKYADTFRRLAE